MGDKYDRKVVCGDKFTAHRSTTENWEIWREEELKSRSPREPLFEGLCADDAYRVCECLNAMNNVPLSEIPSPELMKRIMRLWELEQEKRVVLGRGPR